MATNKAKLALRTTRMAEVLAELERLYPQVECPLWHRSAWELLVATILSAQSTDLRVNQVTPALFTAFHSMADFAAAEPATVAPFIRICGLANSKSKYIVGSARLLMEKFAGEVPADLEALQTLPGVAYKTATVVMSNWYGLQAGFTVDTHVERLARRWELVDGTTARAISAELEALVPQAKWGDTSLRFIFAGREFCQARAHSTATCPLCSKFLAVQG